LRVLREKLLKAKALRMAGSAGAEGAESGAVPTTQGETTAASADHAHVAPGAAPPMPLKGLPKSASPAFGVSVFEQTPAATGVQPAEPLRPDKEPPTDRRVVLRGKRESELRAKALQVLDGRRPVEQLPFEEARAPPLPVE